MLVSVSEPELHAPDEALAVIRQGASGFTEAEEFEVLAAALARQGRASEAREAASHAVEAAERRGAIGYADGLRDQVDEYERDGVFVESVDTARLRMVRGAWVPVPPRGGSGEPDRGGGVPSVGSSSVDPSL